MKTLLDVSKYFGISQDELLEYDLEKFKELVDYMSEVPSLEEIVDHHFAFIENMIKDIYFPKDNRSYIDFRYFASKELKEAFKKRSLMNQLDNFG